MTYEQEQRIIDSGYVLILREAWCIEHATDYIPASERARSEHPGLHGFAMGLAIYEPKGRT